MYVPSPLAKSMRPTPRRYGSTGASSSLCSIDKHKAISNALYHAGLLDGCWKVWGRACGDPDDPGAVNVSVTVECHVTLYRPVTTTAPVFAFLPATDRNKITLIPPPDSIAFRNHCGEETIDFDRVLPPSVSQTEVSHSRNPSCVFHTLGRTLGQTCTSLRTPHMSWHCKPQAGVGVAGPVFLGRGDGC